MKCFFMFVNKNKSDGVKLGQQGIRSINYNTIIIDFLLNKLFDK